MAIALDKFLQTYRSIAQPGSATAAVSMRTVAFILGKASLVAAIGFVFLIGDVMSEAKKDTLPVVELRPPQEAEQAKAKVPYETYANIPRSTMFGVPKASTKVETRAPSASPMKLRLVAVNELSGGNRLAIIEDTQKQTQEVFDVNEIVFGQGKLIEILPDSAKIEYAGRIETIVMQDTVVSGSGGATPGAVESASDDQTDFSVAEDELSAALANLPQLLSQARAVPYFRNGQSIGMRLFAIRSGSMYEKLGLKNGDIVLAVNDNSLSDPAQALKLFEQLKSERSINVKLERNAQNMDMRYTIR